MSATVKPQAHDAEPQKGPGHLVSAVADAVILIAVLAFSAIAIIVIALGAPFVLGVSAIAGAIAPKRARGRWREAHAG